MAARSRPRARCWWRPCPWATLTATRALSNRGRVIVRGMLASVVGRVSMDLTLVDVTDVQGVETGDRVTVLGREGELIVPAEDIARTAGTLSYEITCGVSARVPRRFLQ